MKRIVTILFLLLLLFTAAAQKSSYIKGRFSLAASFDMRWLYGLTGGHRLDDMEPAILVKAHYGVLKFWEIGLYYYFTDDNLSFYNDFGLSNRFHILPFVTKTDSKFFRFDCYIVNNYGFSLKTRHSNYYIGTKNTNADYYSNVAKIKRQSYSTFYIDAGVGASFFFTKHIGFNVDYYFKFPLKKYNKVLDALSLGVIVKF